MERSRDSARNAAESRRASGGEGRGPSPRTRARSMNPGESIWRGAGSHQLAATTLPPSPSPSPHTAQSRRAGEIRVRPSLINFLFNVTGPHCGRGKHVTQAINLRLWRLRPPPCSRARGGPRRARRDGRSRTPAAGTGAEPPRSRRAVGAARRFSRRGSWGRAPPPALRLNFQKAFVSGLDVGALIVPHPPQEAVCMANACH